VQGGKNRVTTLDFGPKGIAVFVGQRIGLIDSSLSDQGIFAGNANLGKGGGTNFFSLERQGAPCSSRSQYSRIMDGKPESEGWKES